MTLTFRATRVAALTGGGPTQDITIPGFGTPKVAWFFAVGSTTEATGAAHAVASYGATDGTNQWCQARTAEDNIATTDTYSLGATDEVIMFGDHAGGIDGEANFDSWITDGVRISWGNYPASAYLIVVVMGTGSDLSVDVGTFTQPAGDTNTVDVACGFEPDQVTVYTNAAGFATDGASNSRISVGFASNNASIEQRVAAQGTRDGLADAQNSMHSRTNRIALVQRMYNNTLSRAAELTSFNAGPTPAAGFTCTTRDTNDSQAFDCGYVALNYNGAAQHKVETLTHPQTNGDSSFTSLGFRPQMVLITVEELWGIPDSGWDYWSYAVCGVGVFTAHDQYATCIWDENGAATTNSESRSDEKAILMDREIGIILSATRSSMDGQGYTLNYSGGARDTYYAFTLAVEETDFYAQIDEGVADDADAIVSGLDGSDTYEVRLESIADPVSSTGHIVRYRYGKRPEDADQVVDLTVSLRQGDSTEIASWSHNNVSTTIALAQQTLSGAEADSITDYSDLRLRFVRSNG